MRAAERVERSTFRQIRAVEFPVSTAILIHPARALTPVMLRRSRSISNSRSFTVAQDDNPGHFNSYCCKSISRIYLVLPQRPEQLAQLALNFQNGRKGFVGFQNDGRLFAPNSFGHIA